MAQPQRSNAAVVEVPPEVPAPAFVAEIPPEKYKGREYYAARDIVHARDGVLRQIRSALGQANGRTLVISATYK